MRPDDRAEQSKLSCQGLWRIRRSPWTVRTVGSIANCNWSNVTAVVRRACHVDASSASGRIASTCLRHGIVSALSAIPVTNPSFSPSGEISRFRLTHTISRTHTRNVCTPRKRRASATIVSLESRLYAIVRGSLRCITTECRKFAVGFAEIELSFASETRILIKRSQKRFIIKFAPFRSNFQFSMLLKKCLILLSQFLFYMANLYKAKKDDIFWRYY